MTRRKPRKSFLYKFFIYSFKLEAQILTTLKEQGWLFFRDIVKFSDLKFIFFSKELHGTNTFFYSMEIDDMNRADELIGKIEEYVDVRDQAALEE